MFANIFRTQARLALTSCRLRASAFPVSRVATRIPAVSTVSPTLRAISTSRPVFMGHTSTESHTLYVGNLPYSLSEEELRAKFEPFGTLQAVRMGFEPDGRSRGFAHIEFADINDAISAMNSIKEEPIFVLDRDLRVDFASSRRTTNLDPTSNLYFHSFRGSVDDMREITRDFERSITDIVFLNKTREGSDASAGFIHFNSVSDATEALNQLDGRNYGDDLLRVRYAAPKRERRERRGREERRYRDD